MYRRSAGRARTARGRSPCSSGCCRSGGASSSCWCLPGLVATSWVITITLSSADATAHVLKNPYLPTTLQGSAVPLTVALLLLLGVVFLLGFSEAVAVAIPLVLVYLAPNAVVVVACVVEILRSPAVLSGWTSQLTAGAGCLSGFETGVSMMPLVHAQGDSEQDRLAQRVRNTGRLLTTAAVVMSIYLLGTAFVTTVLIPPAEFQAGGKASGRALAHLAHEKLGNGFGTVDDVSSILILWFAGASAMAGLINIVPRYLPDHGWRRSGDGRCAGRARVHRSVGPGDAGVPCLRQRAGRCLRHRHPGPVGHLLRYLLPGRGDTPPVVREILRRLEPEPADRPAVHVGG